MIQLMEARFVRTGDDTGEEDVLGTISKVYGEVQESEIDCTDRMMAPGLLVSVGIEPIDK